jgi:hypothetical protein
MTSQMLLIDAHTTRTANGTSRPARGNGSTAGRSIAGRSAAADAPLVGADYRLDERTRQVGRQGLAQARQALAAARPAWAPPPEEAAEDEPGVPAAA